MCYYHLHITWNDLERASRMFELRLPCYIFCLIFRGLKKLNEGLRKILEIFARGSHALFSPTQKAAPLERCLLADAKNLWDFCSRVKISYSFWIPTTCVKKWSDNLSEMVTGSTGIWNIFSGFRYFHDRIEGWPHLGSLFHISNQKMTKACS